MSYDLAIYLGGVAELDVVAELVRVSAGLSIGDRNSEGHLVVTRGARQRFCFSLNGPFLVEPEDLPEGVVAAVLGASVLYELSVEGSFETEIPHAKRFARRLASARGGAVYDPQVDEIWSGSHGRKVAVPDREERIKTIELDVYGIGHLGEVDLTGGYLAAARRFLPEAIPRRFGDTEPLQGKYAEVGGTGFAKIWGESSSSLAFTCRAPCIGGSISGAKETFRGAFWHISLSLHHHPLLDARWRDGLRGFLVHLVDGLPAIYATVQVQRGVIWSGRSTWFDSESEETVLVSRYREPWLGLLPYPAWWSWFGPQYAPLIREHFDGARVRPTEHGLLVRASEEPADRDELRALPNTTIPTVLAATYKRNRDKQQPSPLRSAEVIPEELRRFIT